MPQGSLGFPAYRELDESLLLFDPEQRQHQSPHPLRGLAEYGPFSQSLLAPVLRSVRIAVVAPHAESAIVRGLVEELRSAHKPRERRQYLIDFPGFRSLFGLDVEMVNQGIIELPAALDAEIVRSRAPHRLLAEHLTRATTALSAARSTFDVAMIYLPSRWERAFEGTPEEDFDLHDYLKAITASQDMPSQILRQDKVMEYFCRCSVMWRLGIALYAKAGGVPWKLANATPETAYIGMSYALRDEKGRPDRFVTCCSQVFDADGAGLEFVAYEMDRVHAEGDNPFLSRDQMRTVMARSLALYQQRHGGRVPRRVVVHKSTEFKDAEVDGCFDAWSSAEEIELVQVQQRVPWRAIRFLPAPRPGGEPRADPYPIHRGSFLHLGDREVLLWIQGNAPAAVEGRNFFKEGRGIPRPLLLSRFAGNSSAEQICAEVLGLTKMNWNNDALYDSLPTTLDYAQTLARTIKRMPELAPRPYPFRLFM